MKPRVLKVRLLGPKLMLSGMMGNKTVASGLTPLL